MRQIILDTETTGLETRHNHRIIEIGCVEMIHRKLTGNHFHVYINPQRTIDDEAIAVHGITNDFLQDKPLFKYIANEFLDYIKNDELIIHNAPFDIGFLNHEFSKCLPNIHLSDHPLIDTLRLARKMHPGKKNSLDALCKRYFIDNKHRTLHGALLDSEILADVYLRMTGGQSEFVFSSNDGLLPHLKTIQSLSKERAPLLIIKASTFEQTEHQNYLKTLSKEINQSIEW
jgi:DNA polymerase-3 subunit epsilon